MALLHSGRSMLAVATRPDFTSVTETPDVPITGEAVEMMYTRYRWAAGFAEGKKVLEVGCGAGQGLEYLARQGPLIVGGDCSPELLQSQNPGLQALAGRVALDAHALPFKTGCFELVVVFETVYYLSDPAGAFSEFRRILGEGGTILLCSANMQRRGFTPSPYSHRYFSADELGGLLARAGFTPELLAGFPSQRRGLEYSLRLLARRLHLIPKSMKAKAVLKKFVNGKLYRVSEIRDDPAAYRPPSPLEQWAGPGSYKVIYAVGRCD